ncbi:hypothetical protein AB0I81_09545 [Nonomuraea sp. NPDC050404]
MNSTPSVEPQQERQPGKRTIVVRRLDKIGPTAMPPSQGTSN